VATGLIQVLADGNAEGVSVLGQGAGRWRTMGEVTSGDDADGPLTSFSTLAFSGARAGIASAEPFYQRRWGGVATFRIKTGSSISDIRIVAGLSSSPGAKQRTPTAHVAAFVYDTGAHGTVFWRAVTSDGSGTLTTTALADAIATTTLYDLRINMEDSANVKFYIGGTLRATHTTNLPTSSTPMRCGLWIADIATGGFS
jgi:hypothetical protein